MTDTRQQLLRTTDYQLTITPPGRMAAHRTITGTTPAGLAQAVHRHTRGLLGGQVDIHLDGLTGTAHRNSTHAADLTLTPTPPAPETPGPAHGDGIRWGWTLTDLDRLAKAVVSNNLTWWPAGDRDDLYAAAWHGIVEHLYAADREPPRTDLMEAGRRAAHRLDPVGVDGRFAAPRQVACSAANALRGRLVTGPIASDGPSWDSGPLERAVAVWEADGSRS